MVKKILLLIAAGYIFQLPLNADSYETFYHKEF